MINVLSLLTEGPSVDTEESSNCMGPKLGHNSRTLDIQPTGILSDGSCNQFLEEFMR